MAPITAHLWEKGSAELRDPSNPHGQDMLLNGRAPVAGDIITMPHLATTLKVTWEGGQREGGREEREERGGRRERRGRKDREGRKGERGREGRGGRRRGRKERREGERGRGREGRRE